MIVTLSKDALVHSFIQSFTVITKLRTRNVQHRYEENGVRMFSPLERVIRLRNDITQDELNDIQQTQATEKLLVIKL